MIEILKYIGLGIVVFVALLVGFSILFRIQKIRRKYAEKYTVLQVRVAKENPAMIKRFKSVGGVVYMEPISIAIPNLQHLEACKFFDKGMSIMAKMANMTTEELKKETQARMKELVQQ